jgi:hypothetical protein
MESASELAKAADVRRLTFVDRARGQKRVDLVEASWARHYAHPTLLETLPWLLRVLPACAICLLPDQRDRALLEGPGQPAASERELAGPAIRLLGRLLGLVGTLALARSWPPLGVAIALLLTLVLLRMFASPASNVAGHVMVAATQSEELVRIRRRLERILALASAQSRSTVVAAHSQGGFLVHQLLAQTSGPRIDSLVGVGSGLKPIRILRRFAEAPFALWTWCVSVLTLAWLSLIVTHTDVRVTALEQYVEDLVADSLSGSFGSADDVSSPPASGFNPFDGWSVTLDWHFWTGVCGCLLLVVVARRLRRGLDLSLRIERPNAARWHEVSSPHDPVGRLLYPRISATEWLVPVYGSPIFDHNSYFSRRSLVPWMVASELTDALGVGGDVAVREMANHLAEQSRRRHNLRAFVVWGALLIAAVIARSVGEQTIVQSVVAALPWAGGAALATVPVLLVAERASSSRATRLLRRTLEDERRPPEAPSARRPASLRRRLAASAVLLTSTVLLAAAWLTVTLTDSPHLGTMAGLAAVVSFIFSILIMFEYRPWPLVWPFLLLVGLPTASRDAADEAFIQKAVVVVVGVGVAALGTWLASRAGASHPET